MSHTITRYHAAPIDADPCQLGEGPAWHPQTATWWWLDIEGKKVFRWSGIAGEQPTVFRFAKRPSKLLHVDAAHWLLAHEDEWLLWNFLTGTQQVLAAIPVPPGHRTNDGCIDQWGAAWIGIMEEHAATNTGGLFRMEGSLQPQLVLEAVTIPNGMVWDGDQSHVYFIDSAKASICRYRYHPAQGTLSDESVFLQFREADGLPDGMCADCSGNVWVAFWGGCAVRAFELATGKLIAEVEVPGALQVSSCAFGGPNLDQLLITTARQELSPAELSAYPQSGHVFLAHLPVRGLDPCYWQQNTV